MNILAYYPSHKLSNHDSGVAIMRNGKLAYAFEEQKLSRINHRESKYFPDRAMLSSMYTAGLDPKDIDVVCVCGPELLSDKMGVLDRMEKYFGLNPGEVMVCPHHKAHTALSVLGSGVSNAAFWTLDAGGEDGIYGEYGYYKKGNFNVKSSFEKASLPVFYYLLTGCAGFTDFEEGKVMGLSAYGAVNPKLYADLKSLFSLDTQGIYVLNVGIGYKYPEINWRKFSHDELCSYKVIRYLGRGVCPEMDHITRGYLPEVIAATGQRLVEDLAVKSAINMFDFLGGEDVLCLGGGFFQNIVANKKIREALPANIFVPPGVGDMGLAAGAALWADNEAKKRLSSKGICKECSEGVPESINIISPYMGPGYTDDEVKQVLDVFGVKYMKLDDETLAKTIAGMISDGKVVGWFQGRGEFGARALGARSVFADPRNINSKARVNQNLKKRDWFMPYAPMILEDYMQEYLERPSYSPYMTMAFDVKKGVESTIPSAVHVDGTIRPQIIRKGFVGELLYSMMSEFYDMTGVPVVLNTSFNRHGVPIVATPRQAVEHLLEGVVDVLCVNCFVVIGSNVANLTEADVIPEDILKIILQIKYGCMFLAQNEQESAESIFSQIKLTVKVMDEPGMISVGGILFNYQDGLWDELAGRIKMHLCTGDS